MGMWNIGLGDFLFCLSICLNIISLELLKEIKFIRIHSTKQQRIKFSVRLSAH